MSINYLFSAKSAVAKFMAILAIFSLLAPSVVMAQELPPAEETPEPSAEEVLDIPVEPELEPEPEPTEELAPTEETAEEPEATTTDPVDETPAPEESEEDEGDIATSTEPVATTTPETATTTPEVATSTEATTTPTIIEEQVALFAELIAEAPYAPYCGDGEKNQSWEQCDGEAFCTAQCLFPVQQSCPLNIALAKVNVTNVSNEAGGDMTDDSYLGSLVGRIPNNTWFAVFDGEEIVDDILANYHDVPGLAVRRAADNRLKIRLFGNHTDETSKEHVEGKITFFGATTAGQINDDQEDYWADRATDGEKDTTGGQDEFWLDEDGLSNFWLTANRESDGFLTTYELDENSCVLDPVGTGHIEGRKYRDVNRNGNFDEVEQNAEGDVNSLNGWFIKLYDENWVLVDTMRTGNKESHINDAHASTTEEIVNGQYRFNNLGAGTYHVCEHVNHPWTQVSPRTSVTEDPIENAENIDSVRNRFDRPNYCYEVTLVDGQTQDNVRFGNINENDYEQQENDALYGYKWNDENGDGLWNNEEQGLAGWEIVIAKLVSDSEEDTYEVVDTVTTDENGYYVFTDLEPMTYKIYEVNQDGWDQTFPVYNDGTHIANLAAAEYADLNFGNQNADENAIPVIEILGANPFELVVGNTFVDPFASSTDAEDGDLTSEIATSTNLDINVVGTYDFVYSVTDSDSATAYATRTINVILNTPEELTRSSGGGGGSSGGCRPCYPCDHIRLNCNDDDGGAGGTETGGGQGATNPTFGNPNLGLPGGQGGAEGGLALLTAGDAGDVLALGADDATTTASTTATTTDENDSSNQLAAVGALGGLFGISWWWWILILIILGIIGYYIFRDKENN